MIDEDTYSMRALALLYMASRRHEVTNAQMKKEIKQIIEYCGSRGLFIPFDFIELNEDDLYSKPFNYLMGKITDLEYVQAHSSELTYKINEDIVKNLSNPNSIYLREMSNKDLSILCDAIQLFDEKPLNWLKNNGLEDPITIWRDRSDRDKSQNI